MTTERIDPLAVIGDLIDLALNSGGRRGEDEEDNEPAIKRFKDSLKAKAAVAELVEAASVINHNAIEGHLTSDESQEAWGRLNAALAAFGRQG